AIFKREVRGERETGGGVDLTGGKHGFGHGESNVNNRHLAGADSGRPTKNGQSGEGATSGGPARLLSFQALGRRTPPPFRGADPRGWVVVDHEYRLEGGTFVSVMELDERIDIAEADVVGAGGDAIDRFERTVSRLDHHVELFRCEIAPV